LEFCGKAGAFLAQEKAMAPRPALLVLLPLLLLGGVGRAETGSPTAPRRDGQYPISKSVRSGEFAHYLRGIRDAAELMTERFSGSGAGSGGDCRPPLMACEFNNPPGVMCNSSYGADDGCNCTGRAVTHSHEVTVYSPDTSASDAEFVDCRTVGLAADFQRVASQHDLLFLYSGFQSGVHKSWPGQDWAMRLDNSSTCREKSDCPSFDPRFRNWFIAAATGPKNVVLTVDVSGSMTKFSRLQRMRDAAKTIIGTLSYWDYVGIVAVRRIFAFLSSLFSLLSSLPDSLRSYIFSSLPPSCRSLFSPPSPMCGCLVWFALTLFRSFPPRQRCCKTRARAPSRLLSERRNTTEKCSSRKSKS
jgi:hypothetical protein